MIAAAQRTVISSRLQEKASASATVREGQWSVPSMAVKIDDWWSQSSECIYRDQQAGFRWWDPVSIWDFGA